MSYTGKYTVPPLYPWGDGVLVQGTMFQALSHSPCVHPCVCLGPAASSKRQCSCSCPTGATSLAVASHSQSPVVLGEGGPHGQIHLHSLQWRIKDFWSLARYSPFFPIPLSEEVRKDLTWWLDNRDLIVGVPLDTPPPKMHLLLGASRPRAGALTWFRVCGTRTTNTSTSIFWNSRFFLALEEFQNQMMGHSVVLVSDSTTVVA